jgi:hippurate hydrolase
LHPSAHAAHPPPIPHPALAIIRGWHGDLTEIRRQIHRNPELGFEEHLTGELVARQLERFGVDEVHRGIGKTGLVAVIRGSSTDSGRSIGLRADMDALPMQEENEFDHRSRLPGMMHGCGHDGHTTMLLAAARYLAQTRQFDGTAHLIFQPGEEGFAGAQAMIDDGLFNRFCCDQVFAMHNWPALAPGKVAVRPGPMMAAADRVTIRSRGKAATELIRISASTRWSWRRTSSPPRSRSLRGTFRRCSRRS